MSAAEVETLDVDVLVIGAGMAGLTAAAHCAREGASVLVVESMPVYGGSAVLSGGYFWKLENIDDYAEIDPDGDRALQEIIVEEYAAVLQQIRDLGAATTDKFPVLQGAGHQVDLPAYFKRAIRVVESAGGQLICGADAVRLITGASGGVVGAEISQDDLDVRVEAKATLLATGGFAQSPAAMRRLMGSDAAADLRSRSGAGSVGAGLDLASPLGVATVPSRGFYGHLVGADIDLGNPDIWDQLTLLHSRAGWLFDPAGHRFTDESRGDNINAEATADLPGARAMLVWDDATHTETVLVSWPPGNSATDRFEVARALGAPGRICESTEAVDAFAGELGFAALDLPAERGAAPYRALLVEPTVTFGFAGLAADTRCRVLTESGAPIDALFVAGVDIGGMYAEGYGGGLAFAGTTGLRAARTIMATR